MNRLHLPHGWLVIVCLFFVGSISAASTSPGVTLVSCDRNGAVIEFNLPQYHLFSETHDNQIFQRIAVTGWDQISDPGKPALPYTGVWLAVPPGSDVTYQVESIQTESQAVSSYLPAASISYNSDGSEVTETFNSDPAVYQATALYPSSVVAIGQSAKLRTYQVVPIRINPFQLNALTGELNITESFRLEVKFSGASRGHFLSDPAGAQMAQNLLLNYAEASSWQQRDEHITPPEINQGWGQYKLLVDHDGLYVVTYSDLESIGINVQDIDPQTFTIKNMGLEIPVWVEGEWDGSFDPGDYILFYGQFARGTFTYENIYTRSNVYWLDWGETSGERLEEKSALPGTAVLAPYYKDRHHLEQDLIYEKFPYAWLDDNVAHWMWITLDATYDPEFSYILNLPGFMVIEDQDYDLTLALRGLTYSQNISPDHHVTVKWNDIEVISEYFTHEEDLQITSSMSGIHANPIPNELVFKADPVPDVFPNSFYIDWFEVDYWRDFSVLNDTLLFRNPQTMGIGQVRYEITGMSETNPDSIELWNLTRMQRLRDFTLAGDTISFQDSTGTETYYFIGSRNTWLTPEIVPEVTSSWQTPNHSADYLIITHEDFYDAMAQVENFYEDRGMSVERVKVGDLYDEFSYGLKTPQAIFNFLQYAYYSYGPVIPGYVLLVGDASWDYKDLDPLPYVDYVPTHSFMADRWGETSSDNWFAAVSANPYNLPDMYIGRLPANSEDEIDIMIDKIIDYGEPPPGYWQTQILLSNGAAVADGDAPYIDSLVQGFVDNYFPDWYEPPRVYKIPSVGNEQYQGGSFEMLNYIDEGAAMINYIGHAGNQIWETLPLDTLQMLQNGSKTPFVAAFSCFTGIFSNTEGFGESFLKIPAGGAIGYWSNSSLGYQNNNGLINEHFMWMLFSGGDTLAVRSLGALTTGAKWRYALGGAGNIGDVVEIFNLLGDPAAVFIFDYPEPEDTVDTGPPQITFTGLGENFHSGDFLDNPVDVTITITDDNEIAISPTEFIVSLIQETNSQGVPVEALWPWDWSQDSLAYPDSIDGHTIEIAFMDTLPDGEWRFEIYAEDVLDHTSFEIRSFKIAASLVMENLLNWPNPFNQETNFTFKTSQEANVTIKVYTVSGKLIWVYNGIQEAGYNIIPWDGRDRQGDPISNGTYIYKVKANNGSQEVAARQKLIRIR